MKKQKLTKKEKIQLSEENKKIENLEEDDGTEGYVDLFRFSLYSFGILIVLIFSIIDISPNGYKVTQRGFFTLAIAPVLYSIYYGFLGRNLLMEFVELIKLILKKEFQKNNSYQMNTLVFLLLLIESLLIFIFFIDWSLFGGYMVQVSATVAVIFVNSLIVITKNFFSRISKK